MAAASCRQTPNIKRPPFHQESGRFVDEIPALVAVIRHAFLVIHVHFVSYFLSTGTQVEHGMNRAFSPCGQRLAQSGFFPARFCCAHNVSGYAVTTSLPKICLVFPHIPYGFTAHRHVILYEHEQNSFIARSNILVPTFQRSVCIRVVRRDGNLRSVAHG
jgi:hypothetical protein